jgi:hypothetical protein
MGPGELAMCGIAGPVGPADRRTAARVSLLNDVKPHYDLDNTAMAR